jgi:hypothetical protein
MMFKSVFAYAPALTSAVILAAGSLSSATDAVADGRYYSYWRDHHHYYDDGYDRGGYRAYSGYRRGYYGPYVRRHYYDGGYSGYYPRYRYGDSYPYYRDDGYRYPYYRDDGYRSPYYRDYGYRYPYYRSYYDDDN